MLVIPISIDRKDLYLDIIPQHPKLTQKLQQLQMYLGKIDSTITLKENAKNLVNYAAQKRDQKSENANVRGWNWLKPGRTLIQ